MKQNERKIACYPVYLSSLFVDDAEPMPMVVVKVNNGV